MDAHGGEGTVEFHGARFCPYPRRSAQIENLCGMFGQRVEMGNLPGLIVDVTTPFGVQHELYHIDGNVTVNQGRGFFKACRDFEGVKRLSKCLYLEDPKSKVHMAVLTARLGRRVQVSWLGYMETKLQAYGGKISFTPRLDDNNNSVRIEVKRFIQEFEIDPSIKPLTNDWTVTGKGAVIIRYTWDSIWWTEDVERMVIEFTGRVVGLLDGCS